METCGRIGTLPLKLRKRIYAGLLVTPHCIDIRHVYEHKFVGKIWCQNGNDEDYLKTCLDPILNKSVAILRANKTIHREASQVLYEENKFLFDDFVTCHSFLRHIGDANQDLRSVAILYAMHCYLSPWPTSEDTTALGANIHSVEISHKGTCAQESDEEETVNLVPDCIKAVVQSCLPLLRLRKSAMESREPDLDVTDLIKVAPSYCESCDEMESQVWDDDELQGRMHDCNINPGRRNRHEWCGCQCEEAEEKDMVVADLFKKEIREQLKLHEQSTD